MKRATPGVSIRAAVVILLGVFAFSAATVRAGGSAAPQSSNGRIAFTASGVDDSEIYSVAPASGRETNLTGSSRPDVAPVVSPDGTRILFRRYDDNSIWIMNADGSGQRFLAFGETPAWSPDGGRIVFTDPAGLVATMAADGSDIRKLAAGRLPAWAPDGLSVAFISVSGDGGLSLSLCRADGSDLHAILSTTEIFTRPAWSPDGTQVVVAAEVPVETGGLGSRIVSVRVDDRRSSLLARVERGSSPDEIEPRWSPDGSRLAYVSGRRILVVGATGAGPQALTLPAAGSVDVRPAWSPDGRLLAFVRRREGGPHNVFIVPAGGGAARQVTHEDTHAVVALRDSLAWSSDGRFIFYQRELIDDDLDIYTIESDGSALRRLTTNAVDDYAPSFSPDGRWIAFVRPARFGSELFVMRANGSGARQLTRTGDSHAPTWTPDGSRILFVGRTPGGEEALMSLYTIHPNGTHFRRLKMSDAFYDSPSWSPDGGAIALTREGPGGGGVEQGGTLLRARSDGKRARQLLDLNGDAAWNPEWAPDGRAISFIRETPCSYCDEVIDLWSVRPDGSGARKLIAEVGDAAWSPDGRHLVVQGDRLRIASSDGVPELTLQVPTYLSLAPLISAGLSWQTRCTVEGDGRGNRLRGGPGNDVVCGLGGADTITGGRGRDRLFGEEGNDTIVSRDGIFDVIGCGSGRDTVVADGFDLVGVDCERVSRP